MGSSSGPAPISPSQYIPLVDAQAKINRVNTINPYGSSFFVNNDALNTQQTPSASTNLSPVGASISGRDTYTPGPKPVNRWGGSFGVEMPVSDGSAYDLIGAKTQSEFDNANPELAGLDPGGVTQVNQLSPELQPLLGQQIDIAGGNPFGEAGAANKALLARALDPTQTNTDVRDATYGQAMDLLNPQLQQQQDRFTQRLSDQGIPIDSEAYGKAYANMSGSQDRARQNAAFQAVTAGQQAALAERGQNINELMGASGQGLQGTAQQSQLLAQLLGGNQPAGIDPIDVTGPANLAANQNMAQSAQQQQQKNSVTNAGVGLGTAAILMSDERVKKDKVPVGVHNGVTWYLFKFKDWAIKRFDLPTEWQYGVMANEVQHIDGAVIRAPDGFDRVDYGVLL